MFDLDAYLRRIGLRGRPELADVHRAHSTSIPFENLDPQAGTPASLDVDDLQRKLVAERRGGYCFEQNLLLAAALRALGYEVELYLARVRFGAVPGVIRPRSHLLLEVRDGDESSHADVGFGLGTLLEPLPWGPGGEHEQAGWRYRIVQDGPELVLRAQLQGQWCDLYGFMPHAVPQIDVDTINWWVSTHPHSPFVNGLMVSTQSADGTRAALSDWGELALSERTPTADTITPVTRAEIPELLADRFGLSGFELGADGRLRRAGSA